MPPWRSAASSSLRSSPAEASIGSAFATGGTTTVPTRRREATGAYFVTWRGEEPSTFITQISMRPVRSLWNAMRWPSGNQAGTSSW